MKEVRKIRPERRLPGWVRMEMPRGREYSRVKNLVQNQGLHTICTSGNCPNIGECWNAGTATFMILGDICTRSCKFCSVKTGKPLPVDPHEPGNDDGGGIPGAIAAGGVVGSRFVGQPGDTRAKDVPQALCQPHVVGDHYAAICLEQECSKPRACRDQALGRVHDVHVAQVGDV